MTAWVVGMISLFPTLNLFILYSLEMLYIFGYHFHSAGDGRKCDYRIEITDIFAVSQQINFDFCEILDNWHRHYFKLLDYHSHLLNFVLTVFFWSFICPKKTIHNR